ncbi:hypothetical protein ACF090_31375 [Streptomyces sp. NPDC014892]|uniref:hypothetical protein n=1 Tax=Streptomyces sp. NPDC014892 TaxID=3364930 RepID=UPI003701A320
MATVTFVEETASGVRGEGRAVELAEERMTVRELIRRRVALLASTERPNQRSDQRSDQRSAARSANAPADPPETRAEAALRAFAGNGLLVLVGDREVTELDEEIELAAGTEVTFLRLVPLVGG